MVFITPAVKSPQQDVIFNRRSNSFFTKASVGYMPCSFTSPSMALVYVPVVTRLTVDSI